MLTDLLESCGAYAGVLEFLGIDWLLQSTLLVAVGLLAARLCRARRAAVQSAIYRATFVAVLACPVMSPLLNAVGLRSLHLPKAFSMMPLHGETTQGMVRPVLATESGVQRAYTPELIEADVDPIGRPSRVIDLQRQENRSEAGATIARPAFDGALLTRISLALVWFAGSSVLMIRLVRGWRVSRQLRRSACSADPRSVTQCHALAAGMGVRPPEVLWSALATSPVLVGILRPVVVLPEEGSLTADNRDVLVHELAHLGRRDLMWNLVGRVSTAILFFQPLVWLLMRRMVIAAEDVCDDYVIHLGFDRPSYARRLVEIAKGYQPAAALSVGMLSLRSWVGRRVVRILDASRPLSTRTGRPAGILVAFAALLTTAAAGALSVGSEAECSAPPPTNVSPPAAASVSEPASKPQGLTYQGKVVDKITGEPVEGAKVLVRKSIYSSTENRVLEETNHLTDAQGVYSFQLSPDEVAQKYTYLEFEVTHPRYTHRSPEGYALSMIRKNEKLGEPPFFARLEIQPGEEISGTVVTPEGRPAAGVRIHAYSKAKKDDMTEYGSFAKTETDAEGIFRLNVAKGGEAVLWLLPRQYAPSTHLLHQRRGDLGKFLLEKGVTLRGRVVGVGGNPVGGVWVSAELRAGPAKKETGMPVHDAMARSAVSESNGEFTLAPLPPGDYTMMIDEHPRASDTDDHTLRPVPDVFLQQKLTLKPDESPQSVEIRAVPHVVIEIQQVDGAGKPKKMHAVHFSGRSGEQWFWTDGRPDANGKIVIKAPKGLDEAEIRISTNEHGAARYRWSKDRPLQNSREIKLGRLREDIRDLMIYYYGAPIVLVKAVAEDGTAVADFKPQIAYRNDKKSNERAPHWFHGIQGDVYFEKQEDGRWRSESLLPDEPFLLIVEADGYKPWCDRFTLAEKEVKQLEVRLQPR